ncbi:MAG TPA: KpsF/GutQ family sugar-phosphate isomerase [Pyrinomonadaceae bacterium]|nr:KpsF/GutQ family sugar-phosphate isomerase [Pyrinomonadaceae bacterium]
MTTTVNETSASQVAELLRLEADALQKCAKRLDYAQVTRALELLMASRGKIVLIGMGKSGLIARKIAATLTSTGSVAVYLHPADGLHGDLGIVTADDAVIVLSHSGETDELTAMLPYLKRRQVPVIAIVGNLSSTIANNVDVVLDASVDREACPFNLAPTTSTTVALAIGDALALTLMQLKGLTSEDFALNHPAGRLGKRLSLRVSDLMHSGADNPKVLPDTSWLEVVTSITRGGLGAVNVIDETGLLAGIITDGDLRRAIQKRKPDELEDLSAKDFMTASPVTVLPDELAYSALQFMENRPSQISVLPVVDGAKQCLGLLRLHDLVRSGL